MSKRVAGVMSLGVLAASGAAQTVTATAASAEDPPSYCGYNNQSWLFAWDYNGLGGKGDQVWITEPYGAWKNLDYGPNTWADGGQVRNTVGFSFNDRIKLVSSVCDQDVVFAVNNDGVGARWVVKGLNCGGNGDEIQVPSSIRNSSGGISSFYIVPPTYNNGCQPK